MLSSLKISNYALIDNLDVDFTSGLTIITGETGAGKSIILGALSLLSGSRADARSIKNEGKKTLVEACFSELPISVKEILDRESLIAEDDPDTLIMRREISPLGRSRAFVNDIPVTLGIMQSISERLIDIHSQHQNSKIASPEYRLAILDSAGTPVSLITRYQEAFRKYVKLRNDYRQLKSKVFEIKENQEFLLFQLRQLDELLPVKGEQTRLEEQYRLLSNSEEIKEKLNEASSLLGPDTEDSIVAKMQDVVSALSKVPDSLFSITEGETGFVDRLQSALEEVKDIASTVSSRAAFSDEDGADLEKVGRRLNDLYEAQMRFKVSDTDSLVDLHEKIKRELQISDGTGENLKHLESEMKKAATVLKQTADELSDSRTQTADSLSEEIAALARPLGLQNLRFEVALERGKFTPSGQDTVSFLCAFNKNQTLRPAEEVASGGEMSRLMLAIKSMVAGRLELPTLILDEIDTGVSGAIADKMGQMMLSASQRLQVMAITHLPQVASKGNSHFKVYKEDTEDRTITRLAQLDYDQRVREIANMLSGEVIDEAALLNAKSLLESNTKEK